MQLYVRPDGKFVNGNGDVSSGLPQKCLVKTYTAKRLYKNLFRAGLDALHDENFCKGSAILAVMRSQNPKGDFTYQQAEASGLALKMKFMANDLPADNSVTFEQLYNKDEYQMEYIITVPQKKSVWDAFKEGGTLGEKIASARQMLKNRREMFQSLAMKLEGAAREIVGAEKVPE